VYKAKFTFNCIAISRKAHLKFLLTLRNVFDGKNASSTDAMRCCLFSFVSRVDERGYFGERTRARAHLMFSDEACALIHIIPKKFARARVRALSSHPI
jgi:hypothetical protein